MNYLHVVANTLNNGCWDVEKNFRDFAIQHPRIYFLYET